MKQTRLISGRVPVTPPTEVDGGRYEFLDLKNAEPNLGTAANGYVLTTTTTGQRNWTANLNIGNVTLSNDLRANAVYAEHLFYANGNPYITQQTAQETNIYNGIAYVPDATTLVDSFSAAGVTGAKWIVTANDTVNNRYKSATIDSINDGSDAFFNEYSVITSSPYYDVALFSVNVSGGNINLYAAGDSSNVAITFQRVSLGSSTMLGFVTGASYNQTVIGGGAGNGYTGSAGAAGATGATGPVGYTGSKGSTGSAGPVGYTGSAGSASVVGYNGSAGGASISPNLYVGGTLTVNGDILPTGNNTVNIGSPTARFGTVYISANTIDIGGATVSTTNQGALAFSSPSGQIEFNSNILSFLSNVSIQGATGANGYTGSAGPVGYTGSAGINGINGATGYTGSAGTNGTNGTNGATGYTGSAGTNGYTGSAGSFTGTTSSPVNITDTTASTSTTTGALKVAGGVGVAGDLFVGGTLSVTTLNTINSSQLNVSAPLLYLTAQTYPYNFDIGTYSHYIGGPANTYVHTGAVRSYQNNFWGFFSNVKTEPTGTVNWSDPGLIWDTVKAGAVVVANSTPSTSTTTGALVVAGGVGIGGALNISGDLRVSGTIYGGYNFVLTKVDFPGLATIFNGASRFYCYSTSAIKKIQIYATVAPTGAPVTVRINLNGSPVANVSLASGVTYNSVGSLSININDGDYITTDVTSIGSTYPGSDVSVQIIAGN